jgi:hypothetical protein
MADASLPARSGVRLTDMRVVEFHGAFQTNMEYSITDDSFGNALYTERTQQHEPTSLLRCALPAAEDYYSLTGEFRLTPTETWQAQQAIARAKHLLGAEETSGSFIRRGVETVHNIFRAISNNPQTNSLTTITYMGEHSGPLVPLCIQKQREQELADKARVARR